MSRFLNVVVVFQFLLKQIRNSDKKDQSKYLRVSSTKVCSQHFQDNDFKFVYSRTRRLRDGTWPVPLAFSRRLFQKNLCFVSITNCNCFKVCLEEFQISFSFICTHIEIKYFNEVSLVNLHYLCFLYYLLAKKCCLWRILPKLQL